MKKQVAFVGVMSALILSGVCNAVTLQEIVDEVSLNSYSNYHVNLYTSDGNSRGFSHNDGLRIPAYQHDLARDYIASNFTAMGYDTWLDPFGFEYTSDISTNTYTNCNNVVAVKPGMSGDGIIIIGAHYDTVDIGQNDAATAVTNRCPGADDNASGVAALLEIARVIQEYEFRDTIYLIAFDAEEKELSGSRHFAQTHTTDQLTQTNATTLLRSRIKGMISVDMIAYNIDETPDHVIIGNPGGANGPISSAMEQAVTNYTGMQTLLTYVPGSDHNSFNDVGIDAALLMEGDFIDFSSSFPIILNTNMHTDADSTDTPGQVSYPYAVKCTRCVVGYLCDQAQAVPPATLTSSYGMNQKKLEIQFVGTPGVLYDLYGTTELSTSNEWNFIQSIPPTNASAEQVVEIDISTSTQHMFKVISQ